MKMFHFLLAALSASSLQSAVKIDCSAQYILGDLVLKTQVSAVVAHDEQVCIIKKSPTGEQHPTVEVKLLQENDTNAVLQFFVYDDEKIILQPCMIVSYGTESRIALGTKKSADQYSELMELRCNATQVEK